MQSDAATADDYLLELTPERRATVAEVRAVVLANLPSGYQEVMQYGMIGYVVPLERFPETYNGQPIAYVGLAAQKQYLSLYLMGVYGDAESDFRERFTAGGKTLRMGKSCLRFKTVDDLDLDVIAAEVARLPVEAFLAQYEDARSSSRRR